MSNQGLDGYYNEFQNVPDQTQKQVDVEKIYNKLITPDKDLDLKTDVPDSYPLVTMSAITTYLNKKYGVTANDRKLIKLITVPIDGWIKNYKSLNPSVNGKRASEVLSSLSQFVQYVKNRTTIQKLTGSGDKEE